MVYLVLVVRNLIKTVVLTDLILSSENDFGLLLSEFISDISESRTKIPAFVQRDSFHYKKVCHFVV